MSNSTPLFAGAEHAGQICPVCGETIELHQLVQLHEGQVIHRRCWERRSLSVHPIPNPRSPIPEAIDGNETSHSVRASKVFLLLLANFIPILGPMIAIVTGFVWMDSANSPLKRRDGRELLFVATVLFFAHLIALALMIAGTLGSLGGLESGTFTTSPR